MSEYTGYTGQEIAVIGMAGRFPGAENIEEFWINLKNGVESVAFFSDRELEESGVEKDLIKNPHYVKALAALTGIEEFDANFFNYTPMEAEVMDPQIRLFHECAWGALEDAGYNTEYYDGLIGLYAGASDGFYWMSLGVLSGKLDQLGQFELDKLANKDYLCARVAYKLDLKGPVLFIQTACSTSLVAIHVAAQGLLNGETDIALAGGVTVIPVKWGYLYQEGMIQSPDGHCRTFDARAEGTLPGNGLGIVVLKRLEDAVEDGDFIHAVIKGSAINNDGMQKIGFTAPSVEQQAEVILDALQTARVEAETIGYIEAHGTATFLGDPMEIEALKLAYESDKKGFCGIGSVKTNVGHLDSAAGVTGFIKTLLAIKHGCIPPSLNFETPNTKIDFIDSPFYVNTALKEWERGALPLRAGVTSLGLGGTNVHVILEEWTDKPSNRDLDGRKYRLILLSAVTGSALEKMTENLVEYLKKNPAIPLGDVAYTLQVGRKAFKHRRMTVCSTVYEAVERLSSPGSGGVRDFVLDEEGDNENIMAAVDGDMDIPDTRDSMEEIGGLWLTGQEIDWHAFYAEEKRQRIPLPTYPFERQRYWIEGNLTDMNRGFFWKKSKIEKKPDMTEWFYIPSWKRSQSFFSFQEADEQLKNSSECWLVLMDGLGIGARIVKKLKEINRDVITVEPGEGFGKKEGGYILNSRQYKDYDRLFKELTGIGKIPGRIFHLWSLGRESLEEITVEGFDNIQYSGFYSLLFLVRALDKQSAGQEVEMLVVTSGIRDITGRDPLRPEFAPVLGALKVIPQELPYIRCRTVDLHMEDVLSQSKGRGEMELAARLIGEFYFRSFEPEVAYRGDYRWIPTFESFPLEKSVPGGDIPRLRQKGVYLIMGGLGKIGRVLAEYLVKRVRARVVLVSRSAESGEGASLIKHLENLGGKVLVVGADAANREQVELVLAQAEARFGPVNGVFHAAGETGESISCSLEHLEEQQCKKQFQARVYGLLVLEKVLRTREPDFCLVVSSLVSVLGGLGFAAYAASVIFMDTFVHYLNRGHPVPWTAVNTAEWLFREPDTTEPGMALASETLELSMTVEEGVETFERILSRCTERQVVVSTGDLQARIDKWVKLEALRDDAFPGRGGSTLLHSRPELSGPYVPPSNPVQRKMVNTWQQFFGIEPIGIEDDFFELGGDSLKAITLVSKLHKEFNAKISLEEFFKGPMVKDLAAYIARMEERNSDTVQTYFTPEPVEKREYYPLSSAQERLYLLQQVDPAGTGYNIPFVLPLSIGKDIEEDKLESILAMLMARHESLRSSFGLVNEEPVQKIHDDVEIKIEYNVKAKVEGDHFAGFVRSFDLSTAPLMRLGSVELPGNNRAWVVDLHHIVSDGISQAILMEDFIALYNGRELEPLKLQYKDFSAWQNRLFDSGQVTDQQDYWLDLFRDAGEIPRLQLPPDHKRPALFTFAGGHYDFKLDKTDTLRFKELGAGRGATLFMNILAVLNVLFYKYSGQRDIVIGSGIAGRPGDDLQRVMGMFVNTLAMRNYPRGGKTYDFFLKEVIGSTVKAFENQDLQFERLVETLDLERDPSRNPLFDISMVVQNFSQEVEWKGKGGESKNVSFIGYKNPASRFDMTFFIHELEEEVYIDIEYYTAILEKESVQRLVSHFKRVVKAVIDEPSIELKDIEIISPEEKEQMLHEFNDTARDYPEDKIIRQLFEEQADKMPDRIALAGPRNIHITYCLLNKKSDQLAMALAQKGLKPYSIVGIMMKRSIEMVIGLLGILKAGGAYLPIDPNYPEERINFILKDSHLSLVLNFQNLNFDIVSNFEFRASNLSSSELAYIIYTSGSTGKPKGVMVEQRNVVRLVKNSNYIHFCIDDALLLTGEITFDITTFELWGPLLNGVRLYLADKDIIFDAEKLKGFMAKHRISVLHLIPQLFNQLAGEGIDLFETLRYFLVGGDLVRPGYVNRLRRKYPGLKILHMYGPTENTTFSTYFPVEKDYELTIPIGKPIGNSRVYIVDKYSELKPLGVVGEISVGGAGLARGYLNNPELTAEKFSVLSVAKKLYRTGDLGRWLPDGNIEFLGRIDGQVKIRGVRIELGEIESRLMKHDLIKEALVLDREDGKDETYLCAYIVPGGFPVPGSEELRQYLSQTLPGYMIPAHFITIDNIPVTPNGKIDRKALPAAEVMPGDEYIAPRNEMEKKLAVIWSEVLGRESAGIGVHDNFFHLGGHSLNAAILISKIHKAFDVKVPLVDIFRGRTIRALSEYITHAKETEYTGINPVEKREYYALSSAQKRLYFLQQFTVARPGMDSKSIAYNMPQFLTFGKDIEIDKLELILKELIREHESLRTSFEVVSDVPVQRVHDEVEFRVEYYDASVDGGSSQCGGEPLIEEFIRPFDLSQAPLMRSGLIKLPEGSHIWMVDMHHIISDGTSQIILREDFISMYNHSGEELEAQRLRIQYKDFSRWQNRLFDSSEIKARENYWLELYSDCGDISRLQLPTDGKRPAVFSFAGDIYKFILEREDAVKFKSFGSSQGATLYMNLLGALNSLFYKYTGQEDIIIGSGVAGRPHADLQRIIGMFVNTLAMRNYPKGEKTYRSFLKEVIAHSVKAFENQDVQFEDLVDKLDPERDLSRNPLFDITMVVQNFQGVKSLGKGINENLLPVEYKNPTSKFDLTFFIYELGEDIYIEIEYYTAIFARETVQRLASHFKRVIKVVSGEPLIKLKDIEIISPEEKALVLHTFNDTARDYPEDKFVCQLFEEQAEKNPDSIALLGLSPEIRMRNIHLTYNELNETSNRMGMVLHEKGVIPDAVVGIMSVRIVETIIGILSILKAGGAYLPIDPTYPEERINYILKDSHAKVLLSNEINNINNVPIVSNFEFRASNLSSSELAYIIYTSGSTGKPKGVMVDHRSIIRLVKNTGYIEFNQNDRILQTGALEFDASTFEIWGALLNGLTLCLPGMEEILAADGLKGSIRKYDIHIMWMTSPLFNQMLQADIEIFSGLRYLLVGGDVLSPVHINLLRNRFPGLKVINGYGPTENTTFSTTYLIDKEYKENIPIGKPITNSFAYILDKCGYLQPVNVPGELYVGGAGMARGYLNNPEMTNYKFQITNNSINSSNDVAKKLYRTGDLCRWLPDGNIEFLGRIDHQVKIRGIRIELGEIESRLVKHDLIKEALVLDREDGKGEKYLCAYIVSGEGAVPGYVELRQYLSQSLPDCMIPAHFSMIDNIPLTANGKVDRRALPNAEVMLGDEYIPPGNEIEEKLVVIWSEVLGRETAGIGIHDNFFHLGGHSLKAAVITSKIYKEWGINVPLPELFKSQTIKGLSEYIGKCSHGIAIRGETEVEIEPVPEQEYYELSINQKRLWIMQQKNPDDNSFNMPFMIDMKQKVDEESVKRTMEKIVEKHESLRTGFKEVNGKAVQYIAVDYKIPYEVIDLSSMEERGKQAELTRLTGEFIGKTYSLDEPPLFRWLLIKLNSHYYRLACDMHHIISDGWSVGILERDFQRIYDAYSNNSDIEDNEKEIPITYKDFARWHNRQVENARLKERSRDFWVRFLKEELLPLRLPGGYRNPIGAKVKKGASFRFVIPQDIKEALKDLGKSHNLTLFSLMYSIFNVFLSVVSGQRTIVSGILNAGRNHPSLQEVVGFFVNAVIFKKEINYDEVFIDFAAHMQESVLDFFEHQSYPFELVLDEVGKKYPEVTASFNMLNMSNKEAILLENTEAFHNDEIPNVKFDIEPFVLEFRNGIEITVTYNRNRFKPENIEYMMIKYKKLIEYFAQNPYKQLKHCKKRESLIDRKIKRREQMNDNR